MMLMFALLGIMTPSCQSEPQRHVFATVSTMHISPRFNCTEGTYLAFYPIDSYGTVLHQIRSASGHQCWIDGISVAGEYVAHLPSAKPNITAVDLVVKAIELAHPVLNLGGATIFNETWRSIDPFDGDKLSRAWRASDNAGCSTIQCSSAGTVRIAADCGIATRSLEARTFNLFRHPLAVTLADVLIGTDAEALEMALEVPSLSEIEVTGWPSVRHYLSRQTGGTTKHVSPNGTEPASLTATLNAAGEVQLWRRETKGGKATVLQTSSVPTGCATTTAARIVLFAGSVLTLDLSAGKVSPPLEARLQVFCGGKLAVNISADLGLSFLDIQGFGASVGEAVLVLRVPSLASTAHSAATAGVQVGNVLVENLLDPLFAPATLAPITDMAGVINWDHGSMGSWHDRTDPPYGPNDGVLDVTKPPFSVDNTGVHDCTEAIQSAIEFSRYNYLSLWLPAGRYKVTKSLQFIQRPRMASDGFAKLNLTSNYCWSRFSTLSLRGEVAIPDSVGYASAAWQATGRPGRATLFLPPNTPSFGLTNGNSTAPLAVMNFSNINARGQLEPNTLMSMVLQSVDVVIGRGNPAAVGVRMRGAQGSSVEDVAVFAADDAFAGISGVSGSGGAHSNITVIGARFGIDARDTQPSATLSNIRLVNQTCAALIHEGLETLTIAGAHVVVGSTAEPESAAFITGSPGTSLPGLPATGQCAPLLSPSTSTSPNPSIAGALSLVDVGFNCLGCSPAGRTAIATSRNLYLRRAIFFGFDAVARVYNPLNITDKLRYELVSAKPGTDVHELSIPVPVRFPAINSTAFLDGNAINTTGAAIANVSVCIESKDQHNFDDMCDRHGWGDNNKFPTHAWSSIVNVRDFGARGDGIHDDTDMIQRAIDAAAAMGAPTFIPRGVFRTKSSLVIPRGGMLVGLARHLSYIVSDDTSFSVTSAVEHALKLKDANGRAPLYNAPPILLLAIMRHPDRRRGKARVELREQLGH
jgi:hypothetical protein